MPFILATALFACSAPAENKGEATASGTASAGTGSVSTTGPEVDLMKKAAESWAKGDFDAYLSCYHDTARSVHNAFATYDTTVAKKMTSFISGFKKSREGIEGNINIDHTIFEVVTMPDGSKYGHAWVDCSWKTKSGEVGKSVIFNSYGIKDGKFTYEWPIYNPTDFNKLPR
ncbi:MAG: hypothetical protein RLZ95_1118 [Bacteroidota bacterium]